MKQFFFGLLAGLIGAGIWGGVTLMTGWEIGYVAWGIGLLVGFTCAATGSHRGAGMGVLASLIAIGSIGTGKFGMAWFATQKHMAQNFQIDEELLVTHLAYELAMEFEYEGVDRSRLPIPDYASLSSPQDYSDNVWADATAAFADMTSAQRDQLAAAVAARHARMQVRTSLMMFTGNIHILDALWVLLAAGTAFKIAFAGRDEEDDEIHGLAPGGKGAGGSFFPGHFEEGECKPRNFNNDLPDKNDDAKKEQAA